MPRSTKARKCTETTTGDSKHPDEPSNCIICLEKVVCRGKLSVCNHWFCFPCILEWSENTNTCPICKTRFRCITKIHLDPFRSPPTKVRVGDRDQRVWNDDDDLVADDVPDSDNSNGDQEPSFSSENSQTRSTTRQVDRGGTSGTSRQLRLDDYDYEDSFIDDTDEALQAYLYATYSQEVLHVDVIDNGSEESSSGESSNDSVGQRTSPYKLRNSNRHSPVTKSSRNTRSSTFDSLPNTGVDELCLSPASVDSLLVVSDDDDESSDEMNIVVPTANHSKESKSKRKVTTRKHNSRTRKSSETSRPNSSTSRRSQRSHKPRKQQEPQERCSKSKNKRKRQISTSEDEFQPGTSSRNRSQTSQPSIEGWISMATKRARAHSSTSSTANQRTVSRNRACKGKKPVENVESSHHSEPYESSSDSENEVLIDRIKKARVKARSDGKKEKKCQNASKTSVTTRENESKQSNKFCARQELHQQGIDSPSPSTSTEIQEDDFSIITFIKPTPQPDKKRSIFTRRQHRPPSTSFDHLEDFAISDTEMQQNQSGLTNHRIKTISNHKRAETALVCKSGIVIKLERSPFIKKKKQQRRRVVSLSSDSD